MTDHDFVTQSLARRNSLREYLLRRLVVLRKLPDTAERGKEIRELDEWLAWLKGAI